jgi:cytochrome c-type biogenesis protein CcsB
MDPIFENFLSNFSFLILFLSMLLYWFHSSNFQPIDSSSFILTGGNFYGLKQIVFFFNSISSGKKMGLSLTIVANISLFLLLSLRWINSGHFPLSNLYESLMFLSWSLTVIHLLIEFKFEPITKTNSPYPKMTESPTRNLIGSIVAPCSLFTNAFATFSLPKEMQEASPLVPALQSNWLMMHVTVMILSYAALILGSLLAIGFLIITSRTEEFNLKYVRAIENNSPKENLGIGTPDIKRDSGQKYETTNDYGVLLTQSAIQNKANRQTEYNLNGDSDLSLSPNPENFFKNLSPINNNVASSLKPNHNLKNSTDYKANLARILDNLSYRILGFGFPLLTIGILSGAVWANEAWGSYWSWDPKETWAFLTWLVFAIYLHTRLNKGWEGKKPALIASLGFVTVWVCFLGVNLLGEGLHSYGWIQKLNF